ncbi:MBL fold metallo-hydrolase [Phyllobacterium bourgognense]|uniref:Glyoxylase-like metal-dependent hydrolase (Beta-lactamase superfamily II) n=1 Tax=Phyllobacterium bourgognense TaxID=314236 RepID=A0A368YLT8_9HYPH|nr:MBL fold metallo-hydrolase [Phyllobacterium bourgognense]RCW81203.1 glyoxylase-like metal-dependent hydrolase (beta-lactamase superfamily II) [Phyllobacterium bourgognense]
MRFNCRSMFRAGAATALAFSTPQIMTRAALAAAPPKLEIINTGFYRFMLGEFEITVVLDGMRVFDGPHPTFGADRDAGKVQSLMEANFLPSDRMIGQFNPVLVNTGTDLILFDTGNGPEGREFGTRQLASRIAASGYASSDVTIVAISHLHADRSNGPMDGDRPAFSQARYVVGQAEWAFWTSTDFTGTPAAMHAAAIQRKVLPLREKLAFISAAASIAPGVTSMVAAGPTPGHMAFLLEPAGRSLLLTGDTATILLLPGKPDWEVYFHMDKGAAASSRRRIFDMLAAEKIPFIGYHMPHPSAGYVETLDTGFRFVPVSYQFLI